MIAKLNLFAFVPSIKPSALPLPWLVLSPQGDSSAQPQVVNLNAGDTNTHQ